MPATAISPPAAPAPSSPARRLRRHWLFPAFGWALFHAPVILFLFSANLSRAMTDVAESFRPPIWASAFAEALFLAALLFIATLPLLLTRAYALLAPAAMGLATVVIAGDALLHRSTGFHFNRLFLEVAMQPGALRETGIPPWELAGLGALAVGIIAFEAFAGRAFIRRFASERRPWAWVLLALGLEMVDRTAIATLSFFGGEAIQAAGQVLPLQAPVRMGKMLGRLTGREAADPADLLKTAGQPLGTLAASEVHFERKPDILVILVESLRSDLFDEATMPNLSRRAQQAAVFDRHYSSASSTHFALFSLFYGLPASQRDAVLGAGRTSLLFPSLKANGYQTRLIAASSVNWMGMTRSVFADVQDSLDTDLPGEGSARDEVMMERARAFVQGAKRDEPLFLFLFFVGTHFRYSYPPSAEVFQPCWDGKGGVAAGRLEPILLERRARNAAFEVDRKLEAFLQFYEAQRGGRPLVVVTGDHGEEFLEHGRVGHASDVTNQQLHVPFVLFDEGLEPGRRDAPTGHIDLLPTLLQRLGDGHDPALYCSGVPMTEAPQDRYLLTSVGWEPKLALIGRDLKVRFNGLDAGFGGMRITDPLDKPLADGEARFAREYPNILRSLRRQRP